MHTVHFFAPDPQKHYLFNRDSLFSMEVSDNFTFWTVRAYLYLQEAGFSCKIVDSIPQQGIVVADRDTLGNKYPYLGKTMLICAKGDREFHPSAHLHIVQNPTELNNSCSTIWNPYYINPSPQPNLIPRSTARGSKVENIAFMGTRSNLTPELLSDKWIDSLEKLGCNWHPVYNPNSWHDYTNLDVVVAIRSFDNHLYTYKPASKLINCWRALVPAILTPESAYMSLKKSDLDFCQIETFDDLIESVKNLKNNPQLYLSMIGNGKERAKEFSEDKIAEQWVNYFEKHVFVRYQQWLKMPKIQKYYLFARRFTEFKKTRIKHRIKS